MDLVQAHGLTSGEATQVDLGGDLFGLDVGDPPADDGGVGAAVESGAVAVQSSAAGGEGFACRLDRLLVDVGVLRVGHGLDSCGESAG
ncbi:hypothetical protein PVK74_10800 [Micromonospora chalcea]|uniref:hypothetical protein n=1 Tax=Micromonospora chalcea TaxID=1874 RepID=UPI0023789831|nr:hypothetical protein [Micromonospora chalcea]WDQ02262.1 hypothetical protein PVK74_10800 [Micromonospora chalcea]